MKTTLILVVTAVACGIILAVADIEYQLPQPNQSGPMIPICDTSTKGFRITLRPFEGSSDTWLCDGMFWTKEPQR